MEVTLIESEEESESDELEDEESDEDLLGIVTIIN
jgi:hypothetical protein